jgi:hypothetical protein
VREGEEGVPVTREALFGTASGGEQEGQRDERRKASSSLADSLPSLVSILTLYNCYRRVEQTMAPTNALGSDTDSDGDDGFTSTAFKVNERFADKYDTKKRGEELSKRTLYSPPALLLHRKELTATFPPPSPPFPSSTSSSNSPRQVRQRLPIRRLWRIRRRLGRPLGRRRRRGTRYPFRRRGDSRDVGED